MVPDDEAGVAVVDLRQVLRPRASLQVGRPPLQPSTVMCDQYETNLNVSPASHQCGDSPLRRLCSALLLAAPLLPAPCLCPCLLGQGARALAAGLPRGVAATTLLY